MSLEMKRVTKVGRVGREGERNVELGRSSTTERRYVNGSSASGQVIATKALKIH